MKQQNASAGIHFSGYNSEVFKGTPFHRDRATREMKLLFDGRYITTTEHGVHPSGGIGRYSYNLLSHLIDCDPQLEVTVLVPRNNKRPVFKKGAGRVREIQGSVNPSSLHTQFFMAASLDSRSYDIFHSPFNMLPRNLKCPSAVTIHDIMWLTDPGLCARFLPERLAAGLLYHLGSRYALQRAQRIFTISESTAEAIRGYMPQCAARLTVAHHGVDPFYQRISEEEARQTVQRLCPVPATFVLCVGQGSPYKNHLRAVQAFMEAFAHRPDIKLVLVRRFQRFDGAMRRLLRRPDVQERLILLPSVTEYQLRALYNLATVLLFPSLQEGFGMPVLEAMSCDTPVIASAIQVMREVAHNAAFLVDPYETASIADGLRRLVDDEELRRELTARGRDNIRRFSWKKCAEKTLRDYQKIT